MADDPVEFTDLEVIQRWSLAVRSASADRADVVAALRADLAWLEGPARRTRVQVDHDDGAHDGAHVELDNDIDERPVRRRPAAPRSSTSRAGATRKTAVKRTPAKRTSTTKRATSSKTTAKRGAKKTTSRRSTTRGGTRRR